MPVAGARDRISVEVTQWSGVTAEPHRFGGTEYKLGSRELGHVHGDYLVDIPFPARVRDEVVAAGEAERHHILPDSGWVSLYLNQSEDVERAIRLVRRSYDLALQQRAPRSSPGESTIPQ
jgi:hypothetical protein